MIETISKRIAYKIKQMNPEETSSVEILNYAIAMSLNLGSVIIFSLMIGILTNKFNETLLSIGSFALLRRFSGGYHAKNLTTCAVISIMIFSLISQISLTMEWVWVTKILTLLIVVVLAPIFSSEDNISAKVKRYYKLISICIVLLSFLDESSTIAISLFVQAVLLIPNKRNRR